MYDLQDGIAHNQTGT